MGIAECSVDLVNWSCERNTPLPDVDKGYYQLIPRAVHYISVDKGTKEWRWRTIETKQSSE